MKSVLISLLIIGILSSFCLIYDFALSGIVSNMNEEINFIHRSVKENNTYEAKKTFKNLKNEWEKNEFIIQLLTEHNEIDTINEQFALIDSHFDHSDYDEFFESLYTLKYFINHISEKKRLNLNTIL